MVLDDPLAETNPLNSEEDSASPNTNSKDRHPLRMVTVFILCALSHIITLKYVSSSGNPSMESNKWKPRDLHLPRPPKFTNIHDGDLRLLDKMLVEKYLSVVVYYAPWSRASQKVLDNADVLSTLYQNISFIAINCWLYKSLCKEAFNSWEYPQIVMYHKVLNYTPYVYALSTYPPSFRIQLHRLVNPVINVMSYEELTNIALAHQQTIIGYFDSTDTAQLDQYTKAAVQHHLEHMDAYYIPFISVNDRGLLHAARLTVTPIIFTYRIFKPLEQYENNGSFFTAKGLLKWVSRTRSLITYLNYRTFPSALSLNKQAVIFSSPLVNNTILYQDYMRFVLSYRHCPTSSSKSKLLCDQNRTCMNPCTTPNFNSHHSIISCLQNKPADHHINQCFSLNTRSNRHSFSNFLPKMTGADTVGLLGEDCPILEEIDQTKRTLDTFLRLKELDHVSSVHGIGCKDRIGGPEGFNFYALDSVMWSDMLGRFGIINASRSTEAIIKLNTQDKTVQRYALNDESVSYETFLWGENSAFTLEHSGRNEKLRSLHIEDINRERLEDLLYDQILDVVIFTYTPWCGFCKSLWPKIESLAILLEQNVNLKFVSINIDRNELEDIEIEGNSVPRLYFSVAGHDDVITFPGNLTLTITNILHFIGNYVPVKTKPRGRFPEIVGEPCGRWRPLVLKPSEPVTWPHDLGLSDYSIFDVLEDNEDYTVVDLDSRVRDNGEEVKVSPSDEAVSKSSSSPGLSTCDLDKYIIKLLAQHNSDPNRLPAHIQETLVFNLIANDCLSGADEFWESLIIECYNSIVGHACDHLMMSHVIQQFHTKSPVTVTTVLMSLGRDMFDVLYCFNLRFELSFYLNMQCSSYCGRVCRLIYKLD